MLKSYTDIKIKVLKAIELLNMQNKPNITFIPWWIHSKLLEPAYV